jgi:hypothetical protein
MVARLLNAQHRLNPLHLYCRIVDRGLDRRLSLRICRAYEVAVFVWINLVIKAFLHCYRLTGKGLLINSQLRKVR